MVAFSISGDHLNGISLTQPRTYYFGVQFIDTSPLPANNDGAIGTHSSSDTSSCPMTVRGYAGTLTSSNKDSVLLEANDADYECALNMLSMRDVGRDVEKLLVALPGMI